MERSEVDRRSAAKENKSLGIARSKIGLTLLVIEDDPLITDFLVIVLESVGFRVLVASNGEEGIKTALEVPQTIGLIILDVGLPGMHAARAMARFREINSNVKILISSGFSLNDLSREFPIREIDGFIAKPFDQKRLLAEVEKLLER